MLSRIERRVLLSSRCMSCNEFSALFSTPLLWAHADYGAERKSCHVGRVQRVDICQVQQDPVHDQPREIHPIVIVGHYMSPYETHSAVASLSTNNRYAPLFSR